MPSSTSSSESESPRVDPDSRRLALRTLLVGVSLLTAGMLFTRCQTFMLDWVLLEDVRLREAIAEIPAVASTPGSTALVFGSSLVFVGFSPAVFDARMEEHGIDLQSWNFGFGGLNPEIQRVLARRVRAAFESENRTLALSLVEFNPFQATKARAASNERSRDQLLMMLATPADILKLALESPERAARTVVVRYLRGSITAEAMTEIFGELAKLPLTAVFPDEHPDEQEVPPEQAAAIDERQEAMLELAFAMLEVHGGKPTFWELEYGGELRLLFPETEEYVVRMMQPTPYELERDLENRIRCCDIVDLDFDESLVADFIATVQDLAAVSERVEIFLMPKNTDWVQTSPEGMQRQRDVLERIRRETGVRIADFQEVPPFKGSKFFDVSHLTVHEGMPEFSRILADHSARVLEEHSLP